VVAPAKVVAVTGGIRVLGEGTPESDPETSREGDQLESPHIGAEPGPPAPAPAPAGRGGRALLAGVALVALLGLVGTAVFASMWNGLRHRDDTQHQVEGVGRQFLIALTNFDARTVDSDFARILSFAADNSHFAQQAQSTFNSDLGRAFKAKQASSRGEIHYLFVQGVHGTTADVYAVIDQTIFNNSMKAPVADEIRADVTLQRVKGLWRVSELTVLQAPPVAGTPLTGPTPTTLPGG
jgi:hypothetical protein